jgi:hypothetical protein
MVARAVWKGTIKLAELAFPVALYAAATTSKRISFNILNCKTANRVSREYVDEQTEKPVDKEQQVKGYETGKDQYIIEILGKVVIPRALLMARELFDGTLDNETPSPSRTGSPRDMVSPDLRWTQRRGVPAPAGRCAARGCTGGAGCDACRPRLQLQLHSGPCTSWILTPPSHGTRLRWTPSRPAWRWHHSPGPGYHHRTGSDGPARPRGTH